MKSQRDMVQAAEHATAGKDVGGPISRHPSEADRLRTEIDRLRREVACLRVSRAAAIELYLSTRWAA